MNLFTPTRENLVDGGKTSSCVVMDI